jgi:hypothetical protein
MTKRIACQTLLVMSLTFGTMAWGVEMPKSIDTDRDLKTAVKAAKTPEDHARIAAYCRAKADRLEAQATGYEQAAASYRNGPQVKNLSSPTTPGRYEYMAKELRQDAQASRELAASNEKMAEGATMASK